jgi:hypothetical protein
VSVNRSRLNRNGAGSRLRQSSRLAILVLAALFLLAICAPLPAPSAAVAPNLLTRTGSTRAIAVDSTNLLAEPFSLASPVAFAQDNRTRLMLFAENLALLPGETSADVAAEAEDGNHIHYPLSVEYVGPVPSFSWMTAVIVRLNDNLGDVGDVLIGITVHGATSNRVRVGIGHIGGGPPDDVVSPPPVPDLGPGASLHGKQLFPPDNAWNQDISQSPVDPNSDNLIAGIGLTTGLHPDFGTVWNGAPNGAYPSTGQLTEMKVIPAHIRSQPTLRLRVDQTRQEIVTFW